ncbi:MAG: hypothetical protein ACXAD7_13360 [Candidatus Kariarchaeaceae archaeon]
MVNQFISEFGRLQTWEFDFTNKLQTETKEWKALDLAILFEIITQQRSLLADKSTFTKYDPILNQIQQLFESELGDVSYSTRDKILLASIYLKGNMNISSQTVINSQELLDQIWESIDLSEEPEIQSIIFIFGPLYAIIAKKLFQLSSEFLTKRNLVGALISNFYNIETGSQSFLKKLLIEKKIHPFLFQIVVEGMAALVEMVLEHAKELPIGDIRDQLTHIASHYASLIQDIILSYLTKHYKFQLDENSTDLIRRINKLPFYSMIIYNLMKTYIVSSRTLALLKPKEFEQPIYKDQVNLTLGLIKQIDGDIYQRLNQIDLWMQTDSYPFEWLLNEMEKETIQNFSLILSTTFEVEIIKTINDILEYLTIKYHKTSKIDIEAFEILISFASEWLQLFSTNEILFLEALMVLSAIITICLSQLTRGYYEQNQVEKAFLAYFNLLYFIDYSEQKIKELSNQLTPGEGIVRDDIANKFKSMIGEFNFDGLLSSKQLKEISTKFESSVIKRTGMSQKADPTMMGMLVEETVFGYIDTIQNLEDFIMAESDASTASSALNLHNSPLYYPPDELSMVRFERIGQTCVKRSKPELPFPIIRNIDELGVALSIFPLKASLPQSFYDKSLLKSINEILSMDS